MSILTFARKALFLNALLLVGLSVGALARADSIALRADHPERYTVVRGDTLWDISSRFLRDPWRWAEVWNRNAQIKNPHLIYPGDVVVLTYVDGKPELGVLRETKVDPSGLTPVTVQESLSSGPVVKLVPTVRPEALEKPVPTLSPDIIGPFLSKPMVIDQAELKGSGYITGGLEGRVLLGSFSRIYVRGLGADPAPSYQIFRPGKALRDPDTREVLGYEVAYLGEARLLEGGDPSKLEIVSVKQEILPGDRLLRTPSDTALPYYQPRAPEKRVYGRILAAHNGVSEIGPNGVVALNLGRRDGLEEGHVLRIMRHEGRHRDPVTRKRYALPDEESGLLIVFRAFDKVSYALVVHATRSIRIHDAVQTP